jgi:solute:Na+ symporter, SSS family
MLPSAPIEMLDAKVTPIEWAMIGVFSVGIVTWGFVMRRAARSLEGSFLAGRKVPGLLASLSTVATNLNANDFIGGAGVMYAVGAVNAQGSWINSVALVLVSLFLVQKLRRLNVYTLGGWLERRYSFRVGFSYSLVWSLVWMLFNLGLYLYAGAVVLHTLVGWNLYHSILLLSVISAAVTLLGGFGAVVATDVLQILLMFFPFIFVAIGAFTQIGGISEIAKSIPADKVDFWAAHTRFGPLPIMLFGTFFMGMSYWSTEAQVIQRPLSAKSEEDSIISYLGAAFWFSILMPLLVWMPALTALHFFPNLENPDHAMPSLIRTVLPRGLYGVTIVGLMAGVFSSTEAQINSFCTMFTTDIYRRVVRPNRDEQHYMAASKTAGIIFTFAAIGTAWLFTRAQSGMMIFAISVLATIMPPFAAVTVLGAMLPRMNRRGASAGLISGFSVAVTLVVADKLGYLAMVAQETLYFRAMITFLIAAAVCYAVSLLTASAEDPSAARPVDLSVKWSPRVIRMAVLLAVGMAAMVGMWTYYFPGARSGP